MTKSLTTSQVPETVSQKKLGKLIDLLTPTLRRYVKNEKTAQLLIETPEFVAGFELHVKTLVGKFTNTYMVTVDYARNLSDMIKAGSYNSVNNDITAKNFPVKEEGKEDVEIFLVHPNQDISSENVLKEMDGLGLRAARIEELLAFGETYPEVQRQFPIVALGSSAEVDGGRRVPYLDEWSGKRELRLDWFEDDWDDFYRFAALRK